MFNVGSVQGYLKLNTTGWNSSMRSATASVTALSRTVVRMGAVTLGSLFLIEREFGRFDKAIRHATSVSEVNAEQFKKMSEMALDASVRWNKAAAQTAQAFYFLGSAGLSVTEQMQAFNTTIMLSRAMGSELGQTVEGVVDIVRAFGLEFANIDQIADQLTKTVTSSNQQFRDLSQALSYGAASAKLANNTLAETTAMLGVMANAGIKGSMAGTVLRRAMTNLMAPTGDMAELIYELGVNIYNTSGQMNPFINIMGQISDKLKGATAEYKNMVFETLFGRRAISGQIVLFNYGSTALRKYANEIKNAGGATERVAGKQMMAFTEVLGQLWREMQRVAIVVGDTLAPAVERLGNAVRERLAGFRKYVSINKEVVASTLKWTAAISASLVLGAPLLLFVTTLAVQMVALAGVIANPFVILIATLYTLRAVWKQTSAEIIKTALETSRVLALKKVGKAGIVLGSAATGAASMAALGLGVPGAIVGGLGGFTLGVWQASKAVKEFDKVMGIFSSRNKKSFGVSGGFGDPEFPLKWGDILSATVKQVEEDFNTAFDAIDVKLGDTEGVIAALYAAIKKYKDSIKDLYKAFMTEPPLFRGIAMPTLPIMPEEMWEAYETLHQSMKEYYAEELAAIQKSIAAESVWAQRWSAGIREVLQASLKWQDVTVNMFSSIRSGWATTIHSFLTDTADMAFTFGNIITTMLNNVRDSLMRFASDVLANDLLFSIFGKGKTLPFGTATIWHGGKVRKSEDPWGWIGEMMQLKSDVNRIMQPIPATADPQLGRVGKAAVGDTVINITNLAGIPVSMKETGRRIDGRQLIIDTVLEAINTDPNVRAGVRGY